MPRAAKETAEELVTTARRRLMDWMAINNHPFQMSVILSLAKHPVDGLEAINPRLLASKLAVFPVHVRLQRCPLRDPNSSVVTRERSAHPVRSAIVSVCSVTVSVCSVIVWQNG